MLLSQIKTLKLFSFGTNTCVELFDHFFIASLITLCSKPCQASRICCFRSSSIYL